MLLACPVRGSVASVRFPRKELSLFALHTRRMKTHTLTFDSHWEYSMIGVLFLFRMSTWANPAVLGRLVLRLHVASSLFPALYTKLCVCVCVYKYSFSFLWLVP